MPGAAIPVLAVMARLAGRCGVSAVSLCLLGGLAFASGGLAPFCISAGLLRGMPG